MADAYRHRWEDNIKRNVQEMDWNDLAQDRNRWPTLVNAVMKHRARELRSSGLLRSE